MRRRKNQQLIDELMEPRIAPTVTKQPECLLEAMELISESANNSHLTDGFFTAVELPANYLAERLSITPLQAVMFSLLMEESEDSSIHLREIADMTGCSATRLLRFSRSLDELAERHYLRIRKGHSCDSYRIPREVVMSIRDDRPYEHKTEEITNVNEFFDQYRKIFNEKRADEITHSMLRNLNEDNLNQIKDTHFAKTLTRELTDADERLLFVHMAHIYLSGMDDFIEFHEMADIYDEDDLPTELKRELRSKTCNLQDRLIENSNRDGMAQPDTFRLTDYAKNDVMSEVRMTESTHTSQNVIRHDTIPEKTLIFNDNEDEQISELSSILMPERFNAIQKNLDDAGMRTGFCCLLYGAPGTGKTETVYQIARKTGRDIMQVNIAQVKSCWVGQSERNIKKVFDIYRNVCSESKAAPILLFNEADAILGRRMEGALRGVDKMENSIQNIILQEMENLDGIMIATTNLTENLDKAFERRFLYKIKYEKPTTEARCGIWMQMIKGLTPEDARQLASKFDLTGGEIENVVRKHSVAAILSGSHIVDIRALTRICEQERIQSPNRCKVGF